jgi:hypothetical protein
MSNNVVYAIHFSPCEDYARYQIITEMQAAALELAWGPPELPEFFPRLYVADSEEWLCISNSLEEAQIDMFARWVLCLNGHFSDEIAWFGMGDDPKKVLQAGITYWVNKAKLQLFFDITPANVFESLAD